jgi:hypothetical protein
MTLRRCFNFIRVTYDPEGAGAGAGSHMTPMNVKRTVLEYDFHQAHNIRALLILVGVITGATVGCYHNIFAKVINYIVRFTVLFWIVLKPTFAVGSCAFATVKPTSKLTAMQVYRFFAIVIFKAIFFELARVTVDP